MSAALITTTDLQVHFPVRGGIFSRTQAWCRAVDGVSLAIRPGETLGLVGESGCGKTTIGKAMVRLLEPTGGQVQFEQTDITHLGASSLRPLRRHMQMIFQDPAESLNPRHTIRDILEEPFLIYKLGTREERAAKVRSLLDRVGLPHAAADKFPFEFSGGQRQRIGIARAIALMPKLIVCDEAVSALDVSVQSQVLNLLLDLQRELGLSYVFISHNLAVVKHMSDRVAVMYLGRIVELAPSDAIYRNPRHAYTKALLAANPRPDPDAGRQRVLLEGDVPSPINPPPGCPFGHRMKHPKYNPAAPLPPHLTEISQGHWVQQCACCID